MMGRFSQLGVYHEPVRSRYSYRVAFAGTLALVGRGAKSGILVKGGRYLEEAGRADVVLFDKTGTLAMQAASHNAFLRAWERAWPLVRSPGPKEVCAGRLSEAEAKKLKVAERPCSATADREQRRLAGEPEPKQISFGPGDRTTQRVASLPP